MNVHDELSKMDPDSVEKLRRLNKAKADEILRLTHHKPPNDDKCKWSWVNDPFDTWKSDCGEEMIFEESPTYNGWIFCPFCGKRLEEQDIEGQSEQ